MFHLLQLTSLLSVAVGNTEIYYAAVVFGEPKGLQLKGPIPELLAGSAHTSILLAVPDLEAI